MTFTSKRSTAASMINRLYSYSCCWLFSFYKNRTLSKTLLSDQWLPNSSTCCKIAEIEGLYVESFKYLTAWRSASCIQNNICWSNPWYVQTQRHLDIQIGKIGKINCFKSSGLFEWDFLLSPVAVFQASQYHDNCYCTDNDSCDWELIHLIG